MLYFPTPVVAAVDVRGGAPGTVNTDVLRLAYDDPVANAIVLSGGSSYGLSAATGVANALKDMITDAGNFDDVAVVAGAIIFDLGDRRFNTITPDEELGRAALAGARAGWFPLGARGAGRFAMQGTAWTSHSTPVKALRFGSRAIPRCWSSPSTTAGWSSIARVRSCAVHTRWTATADLSRT